MSSIAPPGDRYIRSAHDNFGVGKRHCRVLHRPTGRSLYPIALTIILG
ncbi:hypothetical protein QUA89_31710 [Microcoleus sp. F10-B4]